MKVEVQLRTISMDCWASLEHKIFYKKNVQDAQRVEQELIACAELAQQLDSRMERIYRETLGDQPASIDAELG